MSSKTAAQWRAILQHMGVAATPAQTWAPIFAGTSEINALQRQGDEELADFLGQIVHESAHLKRTVENLNYSAERMVKVWPKRFPTVAQAQPYAYQPEKLANLVYGNRQDLGNTAPGDGWNYRGRGLIQITGKNNYSWATQATGQSFLSQPDLLTEPNWALKVSIAWWRKNIADDKVGNVRAITKVINGGSTGLAEREQLTAQARRALASLKSPAGQGGATSAGTTAPNPTTDGAPAALSAAGSKSAAPLAAAAKPPMKLAHGAKAPAHHSASAAAAALAPLSVRVKNLLARGAVKTIKPTTKTQTLQLGLLAGDVKDNVEHFEPYGFTSHPLPGAEHISVFFNGDRSHGATMVVADKRYRLTTLQAGEVALYDNHGNKAHFLTDGTLEIVASKEVRIKSPLVTMSGDLKVTGNVEIGGNTKVTGNTEVTGSIKSEASVTAPQITGTSEVTFGSIKGTAHKHTTTGLGAPTTPPLP